MVFSSHIFVYYFFPIALISYYLLPRRAKHFGLTLFSYIFYGWANPVFAPLMFGSTLIDYTCGRIISGSESPRNRRLAVTVSICSNLSLLGFFKYFNFGIANINAIVGWLGLPIWESVLHVTLPLGISFYTFQSMSYTIDVYRGDAKAVRNFIDFACYVSMFPQLGRGADRSVFRDCGSVTASHAHVTEVRSRYRVLFARNGEKGFDSQPLRQMCGYSL